MSIQSRMKGKTGELEVVKVLVSHGYYARRGQQYCGGPDSPDIVCPELKEFHFEVKRVEKLNLARAFEQALADCDENQFPCVVSRSNGERWKMTMDFEDWLELVKYVFPPIKRKLNTKSKASSVASD